MWFCQSVHFARNGLRSGCMRSNSSSSKRGITSRQGKGTSSWKQKHFQSAELQLFRYHCMDQQLGACTWGHTPYLQPLSWWIHSLFSEIATAKFSKSVCHNYFFLAFHGFLFFQAGEDKLFHELKHSSIPKLSINRLIFIYSWIIHA